MQEDDLIDEGIFKSINSYLKIIKDFKPIEKPIFNNKIDVFNIWNLYKRICEAIKSFILLYENNCFYDAYMIAGYILENLFLIYYIKGSKDNCHKYIASKALNHMKICLTEIKNLEKELSMINVMNKIDKGNEIKIRIYSNLIKEFFSYLDIFRKEKIGDSLMLKKNENYGDVINSIFSELNSKNIDKIDKLENLLNNFIELQVSEYKEYFLNNIDNNSNIKYKYKKYCDMKHSDLFEVLNSDRQDIYFKYDMLYLVFYTIKNLKIYLKIFINN